MNFDYPSGYAELYLRGLLSCAFLFFRNGRRQRYGNRRTGFPASHAGVADVPSTPGQLSAMVWIEKHYKERYRPRQTRRGSGEPVLLVLLSHALPLELCY